MAFEYIKRTAQSNQEQGITTASVSEHATRVATDAEIFNRNSVWTNSADSSSNSGESNSGFTTVEAASKEITADSESSNNNGLNFDTSSYENALNDAINRAERQAKFQMTMNTVGMAAGTLGSLFSLGSSLFGSSKAGNQGVVTPPTTTQSVVGSVTTSNEFGLSNNLASAISNYSSKQTNENWTELSNQISIAKNDLTTLDGVVSKNDAVVKTFNNDKEKLNADVKEATSEYNKAQKAVDNNKLGVQAELRIQKINDEEIPAQNAIIDKSNKDTIPAAKTTYDNVVSSNKDNLNATKKESYTEVVNGVSVQKQREVPDTAKREAAQKAIDDAKKKYEDVLQREIGSKTPGAEPTEDSVQGKAKAKIEELKKEIEEKQKVVDDCGGQDKVEEIINARQAASDKLEAVEKVLKDRTKEKDDAVTESGKASSQRKALEKQIAQAEKLMTSKK